MENTQLDEKVAVRASRPLIGSAALSVLHGDCLEQLRRLPSESVNCVVTSPPYFNQRDYAANGQIGIESTFDEYKENLVAVFREVRRVLRSGGTLWLNLGDKYENNQLLMTPAKIAIALQENGWILRADIIWHKPNPMPESIKNRPTRSYEHLYLLTKTTKYFYDLMAIAEKAIYAEQHANKTTSWGTNRKHPNKANVEKYAFTGNNHTTLEGGMRNKRDVWTIQTQPTDFPHAAPFPEKLIEPCILAGCPKDGAVLDPFAGSGTTGAVALKLGRRAVLIELNADYVEIIKKRCSNLQVKLIA
jgi:DNA modification methylase